MSPLLFVALSTMMTAVGAVGASPVPVVSVADAGASNWLRSRRPNGLEKQNINAVQDDTLNACFTPVITRKEIVNTMNTTYDYAHQTRSVL